MTSVLYLQGFLPTYLHREIGELRRRGVAVTVLLPERTRRSSLWDAIAGGEGALAALGVRVRRELPYGWLTATPHGVARMAPPETVESARAFEARSSWARSCVARGGWHHLLAASQLAGALDGERFERIHVHFAKDVALVGALLGEILGIPFSVTAHANDLFVPKDAALLDAILEHARPVFTISEFNRAHLERIADGALGGRIRVARLGVDPAALPPRRGDPGETLRIACSASGLHEKKGVETLVEACALLERRGLRFSCCIIGSDPEGERRARLAERVRAAGLAKRVELAGPLALPEALERVARADVFALPCRRAADGDLDGIPVALMEAMGIGVPVVSTAVSGIPELVDDGETGLLVAPDDPEALADALEGLARDPQRARALAAAARRSIERRFQLSRYVDELLAGWQTPSA